MYDKFELGERIASKRRIAGITQEELIERIGEENLSLSTLKRIEEGTGHLNIENLLLIANAMGYKLKDLIEDDSLRTILEKRYYDPETEEEDNRKEIDYAVYRQQLFYPEPFKGSYFDFYPITTLLQFIVYLPLMDEEWLYHCLWLIEGDRFGGEEYVLDKLRVLFRTIPESKAKRYADYAAQKYTFEYYKEYHSKDITELDNEWMNSEQRRKELIEWHDEYVDIIERKWERVRNDNNRGAVKN